MSKGHPKTLGQRLGLLTGFSLIFGGVLGWAYSLFQSPGHPATPAVAVPAAPSEPTATQPSTTEQPSAGAVPLAAAELEVGVEPGERVVVEHESLVEEPAEQAAAEPEPEPRAKDSEDDGMLSDALGEATTEAPTESTPEPASPEPASPELVAEPVVRAPAVAVPDAVKAIRAAAAAARERLETPARALPDAAPTSDNEE